MRDHLRHIQKQTGVIPDDLKGPPFPEIMDKLWSAFLTLSRRRSRTDMGLQPISFESIKAFMEISGQSFNPVEIRTLLALDDIYLKVAHG